MVLLPDGRKKLRAKAEGMAIGRAGGVEEGVSIGTARTNSVWRQWNARRLEFKARGEPFGEPPPDYADYLSGGEPKRGD